MSVSDSCTLLTSVEERRSLSGTISLVDPKEKEEETHRASFNPVSATKLAVAWNLFAFLSASMTIPTSLLLNCASIPSNALQCPLEAQPEVDILRCRAGGDFSRELGHRLDGFDPRIDMRVERVDGMCEMLGRCPCDWAFIKVSETSSSQEERDQ